MSACTTPVPAEDIHGDGRWMSMHNRYISETHNSEPDIVFIGDSIIQNLEFSSLWTEKISSLHCLNFGIGGDKVENVLWRLLNGEMDFNIKIKAVVLFVGTNNTINDKPEDIFDGIVECIKIIRNKLGEVHIVLPTLLPRGQFPNHLRDKINDINMLILDKYGNKTEIGNNIHVVSIHEHLLQSDNSLSHYIMHDYLHLTDVGYSRTFTAVYEKLCEIVQK